MKQIIILETTPAQGGDITVRFALWIAVPPGQERPLPNISLSAFAGATQDEIDALKAGVVVEEVKSLQFPNTSTPQQIQQHLQASYASRVAFLSTLPFSGKLYGTYWDGALWGSTK